MATSLQAHYYFDMNINENLELNTIAALAGKRDLSRVKQGDIIFRKGEHGGKLYSVVSGEVQLNWGDDGVETIGPGSSFGIGALVDPEHRRFGNAVALCDSELLEMNREGFLFALQELPMFSLEMLHDLEQRLQKIKTQMGDR
jgi:CRP/FNR family cyclic AMP-dependent transcriptional regulator